MQYVRNIDDTYIGSNFVFQTLWNVSSLTAYFLLNKTKLATDGKLTFQMISVILVQSNYKCNGGQMHF